MTCLLVSPCVCCGCLFIFRTHTGRILYIFGGKFEPASPQMNHSNALCLHEHTTTRTKKKSTEEGKTIKNDEEGELFKGRFTTFYLFIFCVFFDFHCHTHADTWRRQMLASGGFKGINATLCMHAT